MSVTKQQEDIEGTIRFILDGELIELNRIDPNRSVLQYLREDLRRTGTKEGCAEGDCGACTILLGELSEGQIILKAVNACILFVPTLDGKALFSVESLKHNSHSQVHPAQKAMVDCHGSQCGFCTPGFIMSMVGLYKSNPAPSRNEIRDCLSGNLCRCTGYKPIMEATESMYHIPVKEERGNLLYSVAGTQADEAENVLIDQLAEIRRTKTLQLKFGQNTFTAPTTLNQFAKYYADNPDSLILAGGTDIGLWVTKQLRQLNNILYLGSVDAFKQIEASGQHIKIGAAVNLNNAYHSLCQEYPELKELYRRFASTPIRNSGTLIGNIANGSPIGDSMPALIALGARLILRHADKQREIPLEALYIDYQKTVLQPGEFVEAILVPKKQNAWQMRTYKIAKRYDQDISAVCAAFNIKLTGNRIDDVRIAYGGMAAIPKRAENTEKTLLNQTWDKDRVKNAMEKLEKDFKPLTDMRASSAYRQQVARNCLHRFYLETREQSALSAEQIDVFQAV